MKRDVICTDPIIGQWVARELGINRDFGASTCIGFIRGGRIIAGAVYKDYQPEYRTMEMALASISPTWGKPENIKVLYDYPFVQLNIFRLWATTAVDNFKTIKFLRHLGAKQEAMLEHAYGEGQHAVLYRWLQPEYMETKYYG